MSGAFSLGTGCGPGSLAAAPPRRGRFVECGEPERGRRKGASQARWDQPHDCAEAAQERGGADQPMGPAEPHATTLGLEQEAMIVAVRRHALVALDDGLYALQPSIPGPTRLFLHRRLPRHGISGLPDIEGDKPAKKRFKAGPVGRFHTERAVVRHRSENHGGRRGPHKPAQAQPVRGH